MSLLEAGHIVWFVENTHAGWHLSQLLLKQSQMHSKLFSFNIVRGDCGTIAVSRAPRSVD